MTVAVLDEQLELDLTAKDVDLSPLEAFLAYCDEAGQDYDPRHAPIPY